ncbi:MAG: pacearchaeosortase [Candidatus Nanoarchaeia archaeon]
MKKRKKEKKNMNNEVFIFFRYIVLLLLMFSLPYIYAIATPLTVSSTAFFLNIFYKDVVYSQEIITVNNCPKIEIIDSCVAGSAYLLLLMLNLSVPMNAKKRFFSLLFSVFSLFLLNLSRIVLLSVFFINKYAFYDFTHKIFWYFLSTFFVVGIWFLTAFIFKIKEIPLYSDLIVFIKNIKKHS